MKTLSVLVLLTFACLSPARAATTATDCAALLPTMHDTYLAQWNFLPLTPEQDAAMTAWIGSCNGQGTWTAQLVATGLPKANDPRQPLSPGAFTVVEMPNREQQCDELVPSIQHIFTSLRYGDALGPWQHLQLHKWQALCPTTPSWTRLGVQPADAKLSVRHAPGSSPRIRTECRTYAISGMHCITWTE